MQDPDGDALVQLVGLAAMQRDVGQRDAILRHEEVVGATRKDFCSYVDGQSSPRRKSPLTPAEMIANVARSMRLDID